jgi:MFS family permease
LAATTISLPLLSNYWAIIGDILIFGLGMSLSTIATSTYIPEKVAPTELASSLGLLSSIMDIGQSFGPFLIGFIITAYSYSLGFYLSGLLALVVAGIFFWKNYQPAAQLMNNQ